MPCWSLADAYLRSTSRWEHSGSPSIAGNSNREIRLLSHIVERLPWSQAILLLLYYKLRQISTHSARESDLFIFLVFYHKNNILYLSPQTLIKMEITGSNNGVWKDFIYCTDDPCFKLDLYNF
jgi:hypothetical protein